MLTTNQWGIILSIVVYLFGMLWIGYSYSKKTKNTGDFYLGGRKLGPFVTAMSAEASDMSGWLLMGLPGVALAGSIAEAAWTAIGLAVGTYINWLVVAKRLRRYTEKCGNSVTLPEFFHNRYQDTTKILRTVAAIIIVIFFVPYTASGFAACGKLFAGAFGWDYTWCMIISAIVIVAYTSMGGFSAASTTDFVQSIIMSFALVGVLIFGIVNAGGMDAVIENAKDIPGYFSLTTTGDTLGASGEVGSYNGLTIASTLAWGLGYFGMPHILLRFMAIKDENKLKLSRRVATIWVVISMAVAVFIGIMGYSLYKNGAVPGVENDAEKIIVIISMVISKYGFIFAILAGLVLAGILASTMSTADSQLLAASSSISEDFAGSVFKKQISQKTKMLIARITVIAVSIIGVILALNPDSNVFNIVSFAWAGFGAAFGPVVLAALFWKRSNAWGAIASVVVGAAMVFIWKFAIAPMGGAWAIYELLPAFICACIANVVVSLVTPAPKKQITDLFKEI
ncbi:MAG: sodium/proline symporter PutP [Clostridia bacterium]|nr:sodium/proline symporter PutP [Clostridia bacterium]